MPTTYTLQSVELLSPLLNDDDTQLPEWRCWLLHVEYLKILLQHSFTAADLVKLDNLIIEHQTLFLQVLLLTLFPAWFRASCSFRARFYKSGPMFVPSMVPASFLGSL